MQVRVDPELEWLAEIKVQQAEHMWIMQLERETTIDAQADAVTALAMHAGSSFAALNALRHFLGSSEKGFCRLRGLAARSVCSLNLGHVHSTFPECSLNVP
jgi:hypothetical protein